jgi:hypothetical protein
VDHDEESGAVVVEGLQDTLAEASSSSWARRAQAGGALAPFAEIPEAAEVLKALLLDGQDTAVTRQTAQALIRAGTVAAAEILAQAVAGADDSHTDWIQTGVDDALAKGARVRDLLDLYEGLTQTSDTDIRQGAAAIRTWAKNTEGRTAQ